MKRKIFKISLPYLLEFFCTGADHRFKVLNGFPDDAKIIDIRFDGFSNSASILIESKSFDTLIEGRPIPEAPTITISRLDA